jgi:uroporphyrinogen decarboxylase
MLTPKERMAIVAKGLRPDQVPFAPVVYEHASKLIGTTPSILARDPDLIVKGQLEAYRRYRMDIVSVGVDIYNIEAEALGCEIRYFDNSPEIPGVVTHILEKNKNAFNKLRVPDPFRDGRMPVFLEACRRIHQELGKEVQVNATIVGPFTLAALLRRYEKFVMDILDDPPYAKSLLEFTFQVGLAYGTAFSKVGVGISVNESWITPPMLSPELFRDFPFPYEKELITQLKRVGFQSIGLISGGNTLPIAPYLVQTGTSILAADANTDQLAYKKLAQEAGIILRVLIDAKLLSSGTDKEIEEATLRVLKSCAGGSRFILGCGVVPYEADSKKILKFREVALAFHEY